MRQLICLFIDWHEDKVLVTYITCFEYESFTVTVSKMWPSFKKMQNYVNYLSKFQWFWYRMRWFYLTGAKSQSLISRSTWSICDGDKNKTSNVFYIRLLWFEWLLSRVVKVCLFLYYLFSACNSDFDRLKRKGYTSIYESGSTSIATLTSNSFKGMFITLRINIKW